MKPKPISELRMLVAEKLLDWAMTLAPKDHADSPALVSAIAAYLRTVHTARPKHR